MNKRYIFGKMVAMAIGLGGIIGIIAYDEIILGVGAMVLAVMVDQVAEGQG